MEPSLGVWTAWGEEKYDSEVQEGRLGPRSDVFMVVA